MENFSFKVEVGGREGGRPYFHRVYIINQIEPPDGIDISVNVLNKHAAYIVEHHDYGLHPIIDAMEVAVDTAAQVAKGYRLEAV